MNNINVTAQLELSLNGNAPRAIKRHRQTRIERAAWWFARMRAAVDNAMTWPTQPKPQPEQIWIPQTQRQAGA